MRVRSIKTWGLVLLLWIAVVGSSFAVVLATYQVRMQTHQLEELRGEASELRVQWGRYLLEQSTWGSYKRVESVAVKRLNMSVPDGEKTRIIMDDRR